MTPGRQQLLRLPWNVNDGLLLQRTLMSSVWAWPAIVALPNDDGGDDVHQKGPGINWLLLLRLHRNAVVALGALNFDNWQRQLLQRLPKLLVVIAVVGPQQ